MEWDVGRLVEGAIGSNGMSALDAKMLSRDTGYHTSRFSPLLLSPRHVMERYDEIKGKWSYSTLSLLKLFGVEAIRKVSSRGGEALLDEGVFRLFTMGIPYFSTAASYASGPTHAAINKLLEARNDALKIVMAHAQTSQDMTVTHRVFEVLCIILKGHHFEFENYHEAETPGALPADHADLSLMYEYHHVLQPLYSMMQLVVEWMGQLPGVLVEDLRSATFMHLMASLLHSPNPRERLAVECLIKALINDIRSDPDPASPRRRLKLMVHLMGGALLDASSKHLDRGRLAVVRRPMSSVFRILTSILTFIRHELSLIDLIESLVTSYLIPFFTKSPLLGEVKALFKPLFIECISALRAFDEHHLMVSQQLTQGVLYSASHPNLEVIRGRIMRRIYKKQLIHPRGTPALYKQAWLLLSRCKVLADHSKLLLFLITPDEHPFATIRGASLNPIYAEMVDAYYRGWIGFVLVRSRQEGHPSHLLSQIWDGLREWPELRALAHWDVHFAAHLLQPLHEYFSGYRMARDRVQYIRNTLSGAYRGWPAFRVTEAVISVLRNLRELQHTNLIASLSTSMARSDISDLSEKYPEPSAPPITHFHEDGDVPMEDLLPPGFVESDHDDSGNLIPRVYRVHLDNH